MAETAKRPPGRPARDLAGQEFGMLKVLSRIPGVRPPTWLCLCDPALGGCGRTCQATSSHLVHGSKKSCGCLHGTRYALRNDTLLRLAANLASLNELTTELVSASSGDPEFAEMARSLLRDHSWSLGFEFQGEPVPADFTPSWEKTGEDA